MMSVKKIFGIVLIALLGLSVVIVLGTPLGENGAYKLVSSKADNIGTLINKKDPSHGLKTMGDIWNKEQNDPAFKDAMSKYNNLYKAYKRELTLINSDKTTYGATDLIYSIHKDKTLSDNDKISLYMQISSVIDDYSNKYNNL
jgi:hypothetical protein